MALYNVGDRVVVRENLGVISSNYRYGHGYGMERFNGHTVTITRVIEHNGIEDDTEYIIAEDNGGFSWGSADFAGFEDGTVPTVQPSNVLTKADIKEAWGQYCDTDKLVDDMRALLTEYGHRNTEHGVCTMLNEYFTNKKDLIELFQKSEHYMGDMRIMIDIELERENNADDIYSFCENFYNNVGAGKLLLKYEDEYGKKIDDYIRTGIKCITAKDLMKPEVVAKLKNVTDARNKFADDKATLASHAIENECYSAMRKFKMFRLSTIDKEFSESMDEKYKVREGMKTSRAFNRVCGFYGIDKLPKYNKLFAKYADMVSGLKRKLKFFISVNPIDYLTMSFGVNWASCHTIDKENRRHMESSYHGMYCAGTVSYMLDATSIITFVHDHADVDFANEGKIFRNMFHYGKDILVQARVYPQGNDGNIDLYSVFRNYVQNELTPLLGLTDTTWRKKENGNVSNNVRSCGAHYRDYTSFSSCNVSYPRERSESRDNVIEIGHRSICPFCGREINEGNGVISHSNCLI